MAGECADRSERPDSITELDDRVSDIKSNQGSLRRIELDDAANIESEVSVTFRKTVEVSSEVNEARPHLGKDTRGIRAEARLYTKEGLGLSAALKEITSILGEEIDFAFKSDEVIDVVRNSAADSNIIDVQIAKSNIRKLTADIEFGRAVLSLRLCVKEGKKDQRCNTT